MLRSNCYKILNNLETRKSWLWNHTEDSHVVVVADFRITSNKFTLIRGESVPPFRAGYDGASENERSAHSAAQILLSVRHLSGVPICQLFF